MAQLGNLIVTGRTNLLGNVYAQNIIGNISTATKLATPKTINGTSFDGTSNITTSYWGTLRDLKIGNQTLSVNGSGNYTWTKTAMGVMGSTTITIDGYYGIVGPDDNADKYIRTPKDGIIPFQSGGSSTIGTASWPFNTIYSKSFVGALTGNASTATQFSEAATVKLTGDVTGSASSAKGWTVATTLANSGVSSGSYGQSANATAAFSGTFKIPYFTVDAKGRITSASTKTITMPANPNTNTAHTTFAWSNGDAAGPTGTLSGNHTAVNFPAIPTASASISGIVTTGTQTFAGSKTFNNKIVSKANTSTSWIRARDSAFFLSTAPAAQSVTAVCSFKTPSGAWAIGGLADSEDIFFSYGTDADYNAGSNNGKSYYINTDGAFSGTIEWSHVNSRPTGLTLKIGNTSKQANLSATTSWTLAEIGAAPSSHSHSYLPLSGGNMTGDIGYTAAGTSIPMIKFLTGTDDGHGLILGGGGLVSIGSGESASNIVNAYGYGGSQESMFVTADSRITFATNCQTIANRKTVVLNENGDFYPEANGQGYIGTSDYHFAGGYINSLYASTVTIDNTYYPQVTMRATNTNHTTYSLGTVEVNYTDSVALWINSDKTNNTKKRRAITVYGFDNRASSAKAVALRQCDANGTWLADEYLTHSTNVYRFYYGSTAPTSPETGDIWFQPL